MLNNGQTVQKYDTLVLANGSLCTFKSFTNGDGYKSVPLLTVVPLTLFATMDVLLSDVVRMHSEEEVHVYLNGMDEPARTFQKAKLLLNKLQRLDPVRLKDGTVAQAVVAKGRVLTLCNINDGRIYQQDITALQEKLDEAEAAALIMPTASSWSDCL